MLKERLKFELRIGVGKNLITVKVKSCDIKNFCQMQYIYQSYKKIVLHVFF